MIVRVIAAVLVLAIPLTDVGAAGSLEWEGLPLAGAAERVITGNVAVNRTPASYCLFFGRSDLIDEAVRTRGWLPASNVNREIGSPVGLLEFREYRRDEAILLVGRTGGADEEDGYVVMVRFKREPVWLDGRGEAPGRDPAGWPRLASSYRLIHLAGAGFEAACYRSPAPVSALVSQAQARLTSAGWSVVRASASGLAASRPGNEEVVLVARAARVGCTFIVMQGL